MNNTDLTVKEIFILAHQNHQQNKLKEATNYYNQVLKIEPNHSQALNNIALIFARHNGNFKKQKIAMKK